MSKYHGTDTRGRFINGDTLLSALSRRLEAGQHYKKVCVSYSLVRAQLRLVFCSMTRRADGGSCAPGRPDLDSYSFSSTPDRHCGRCSKMYRVIKLCSCDQKLLLILWMTNADKPIEAFQLTTIIFSTYTRSSSAENGETSRLSVGVITRFLHWRHDHWR